MVTWTAAQVSGQLARWYLSDVSNGPAVLVLMEALLDITDTEQAAWSLVRLNTAGRVTLSFSAAVQTGLDFTWGTMREKG